MVDTKWHHSVGEKQVPSKLHVVEAHVPDYVRFWNVIGLFGEDPVESLHKVINQLRRMHAGIKNRLCYLQVVADAMNLTFEQACRDAGRQQKKRNKRKRAQ